MFLTYFNWLSEYLLTFELKCLYFKLYDVLFIQMWLPVFL